jgi:hypothetical protein
VKPVRSGSIITFPHKVIARGVVRTLGRLLLPVAFRIRVTGRENFPKRGPLLVVENHTAAMEAVLMLDILHTTALAKLLHRPVVLKIFSRNLRLPTSALQNLEHEHDAGVIADATRAILDYLSLRSAGRCRIPRRRRRIPAEEPGPPG